MSLYEKWIDKIEKLPFDKNYICLLVDNYSKQSYPLLEYVNTVGSLILYDDIFVNQKNTNKILNKSKKVLSIDDRLLYGK